MMEIITRKTYRRRLKHMVYQLESTADKNHAEIQSLDKQASYHIINGKFLIHIHFDLYIGRKLARVV